MDKSGIFVGATVGSISVFIIFAVLFIIPLQSDVDEINNVILTESKTLSLIDIFEKAEPGVVRVNIQRNQTENEVGVVGSGFVFDKRGHIITNAHVIKDSTKTVVTFLDGRSYNAEIIGVDEYTDIGVIKVNADLKLLHPLSLGDSSNLQVGEPITAIGNPFGLGGTVTAGIISARNREIGLSRYEDYIQTDASINIGNSGGPLFNLKGDVIGINTAILGQAGSIGIGFAIPSNSASAVIDQLIEFGETKRGWLGVRIQEVSKEIADVEKLDKPKGALVASVAKGSPSDKAGIKAGDIILEFDGKEVDTMRTLPKIVAKTKVGKSVIVKIWRNQKLISKKVILGRLESSGEFKTKIKPENEKKETSTIDSLKIKVRILTDKDVAARKLPEGTKGLVITKIELTSPLNYLQVNDIIVEVQKKKITSIKMLNDIVNDVLQSDESNLLIVVYNNQNQRRYLGVKIK